MGGIAWDAVIPDIVHADDWLFVVDKPPGMPSVPARTDRDPPSVIERLRESGQSGGFLEAAHRLDRDTSGLLVVARSPESRRRLSQAFERGLVRKRYLAVVEGRPPADEGTIHLPLARDPASPPRQRVDPEMGVRATTRWRLVDKSFANGREVSLLELEPVTGRSHQLRVHLAWLGTRIVGDPLYGTPCRRRPGERMLLHAVSIDLPHPRDGGRLAVRSPAEFMPAGWFDGRPASSPTAPPCANTGKIG